MTLRAPFLSPLLVTVLLGACGGATGMHPAGPPMRPGSTPAPPDIVEEIAEPPDCAEQDPTKGPGSKPYADRVIDLAANLAEQGLKILLESEERSRPRNDVELKIRQAVDKFIEALALDPYNVKATYNLAAAYARIGRRQCALNLLARLAEMSTFPSQQEAIGDARDRLFGTGKKWKGNPDPDFDDLRSDPKFLEIVKDLD